MAFKHIALMIFLAATSIAIQAQPIDQQTSIIQTADFNVRTQLETINAGYVADANSDQIPDLIWANENGIFQALGTGNGLFDATTTLHDDTASAINYIDPSRIISGTHIDLNGDGLQDFIAKRPNSAVSSVVSRITFILSGAANTSVDLFSFPTVPMIDSDFKLHDFIDINNDGAAELITLNSSYNGNYKDPVLKTFSTTLNVDGEPTAVTVQMEKTFDLPAGTEVFQLKLADVNNDKKLDAVFLFNNDSDTSDIYLLKRADLVVYYQQDNLTWSDMNLIKKDIIVDPSNTQSNSSNVLLEVDIHVEDMDGDGNNDILTYHDAILDTNTYTTDAFAELFILWQENDGSFTEQSLFNDSYNYMIDSLGLTITDLNSDNQSDIIFSGGHLDITVPAIFNSNILLTNLGNRNITSKQYLSPANEDYQSSTIFINDFNQDQQKDIIFAGVNTIDFINGDQNIGLFYINPDIYPPVATFTPDNSTHNNTAYNVSLTVNENVTGLVESDVEINGGSISNWQEMSVGLSYQFTVTPNNDENTVLSVKAQSFSDVALQKNIQTSETTIASPVILPPVVLPPVIPPVTSPDDNNHTDTDGDGISDALESGDYNGDGIDDSQQADPGIESGIASGAINPWLFLLALPLLLAGHSARATDKNVVSNTDMNSPSLWQNLQDTAYVGINLGFSYLNPEDDNSGWKQQDSGTGSHGLTLGFRPHPVVFVEYSHQELGKATFENENPNIPGKQSLRYSADSLISGVYLNEDQPYKIFVRAGLTELHTESSASINNDQKNKTLLSTGTGVEWKGMDQWQLRLGADRYSADVHNVYFSAQYQFK